MDKLQIGDVVTLTSGGDKVVVCEVDTTSPDYFVKLAFWQNGSIVQTNWVDSRILKKVA